MDTLTHGLSGALIGRILSKKSKVCTPRTFMLVGAFGAIFPDFDFILRLFGKEFYMWNHRGVTHSFFLLPLYAAMIAALFAYIIPKLKSEHWLQNKETATFKSVFKDLYLLSALSIFAHVCADIITAFGTMFLWPIQTRFEIGSVFVIDLFFVGIIISGLLASWKFGKDKIKKSNIATVFSILLLSYIGLTQWFKYEAKDDFAQYVQKAYPDLAYNTEVSYTVYPNLMLPTNWIGVAYDAKKDEYYHSTFSLISNNLEVKTPLIKHMPKWLSPEMKEQATTAWETEDMKFARWFMAKPVVTSISDGCVFFEDLRYRSNFRWENPFAYGVCKDKFYDGKDVFPRKKE